MTQADGRILETLADSDLVLSPRILAVNTDYSRHYVSRRLGKLHDAELVEKVDDGLYQITEKGRDYLTGDLQAGDLQINQE
ncbi:MarR family transcriptional regulator [Halomicrobium sp. IBSBa]|uniref:MarR family transcriptional regulator n=1 Tax=Halomicrobium sp. IBSBa TaxID=2778916 RepID=UPI001FC9CB13|nr:helix-turn-helix domain-containing protein [Halomicrobium sp. IBSBa]MBO4249531.1 MarR family transcriptional regulator [Halomicrobium sp. IBSBa]